MPDSGARLFWRRRGDARGRCCEIYNAMAETTRCAGRQWRRTCPCAPRDRILRVEEPAARPRRERRHARTCIAGADTACRRHLRPPAVLPPRVPPRRPARKCAILSTSHLVVLELTQTTTPSKSRSRASSRCIRDGEIPSVFGPSIPWGRQICGGTWAMRLQLRRHATMLRTSSGRWRY